MFNLRFIVPMIISLVPFLKSALKQMLVDILERIRKKIDENDEKIAQSVKEEILTFYDEHEEKIPDELRGITKKAFEVLADVIYSIIDHADDAAGLLTEVAKIIEVI
ncbi:hypothetical protein [Marinitoga lauensis]|uniref:hypothetical protein n=1 Tax=Marinitoga lauensis TaxID=2201189 RepID=UPI00101032B8|nr:hypothetical protein [Marinitoga lauensis]